MAKSRKTHSARTFCVGDHVTVPSEADEGPGRDEARPVIHTHVVERLSGEQWRIKEHRG